MDAECEVEIKEEPFDEDHMELVFVREQYFDFHGILQNAALPPLPGTF